MIYKLLAINIDGTLLQSNGRFSKAAKEAIEYVQAKDVAIALVTSRNYQSCKKIAKSLRINPMIIAAQGAFVGMAVGKPLFVQKLPELLTINAVKSLEDMQCQIKVNYEALEIRNRINLPENLLGKAVMYVSEQKIFAQGYVDQVSDYLLSNDARPLSVEADFQSYKQRQEWMGIAQALFKDATIIPKEHNRVIIVSKSVGKWQGLLRLADHLKIERQEIVAIGDSADDGEMIAASGIGVAMGNSPYELKCKANWITRGNDDDGVAYMVKELFRKQYQLQFLEKMNLLK